MPLASTAAALTQYDANPPSTWGSNANALACLDAVYYLLAHRAEIREDQDSKLTYASLESAKTALEARVNLTQNRANGRSRRVGAGFGQAVIS